MFKVFEKWFTYFQENKIPIPNNFNVHLILNILVVLFNTQESLAITAALYFWYEHCSQFSSEVNSYFLNVIVKFYFFKLLLNWSKNVRDAFLYYVCFKVMYMYESNQGNELFDSLLLTINQYLNVIKMSTDLYNQRLFSYNQLPKIEKRRLSLQKVKQEVINRIEFFDKKKLSINFFNGVAKFEKPFANYLNTFSVVNDYFMNAHNNENDSPVESPEHSMEEVDSPGIENVNKLRFLRINSVHLENIILSFIGENEIAYCTVGIADFKASFIAYKKFKSDNYPTDINQFPKLKMRLPIDEFEFMEGSEWEW